MSAEHPSEQRLDDYVDSLLSPDASAEVERHLRDCARCRSYVSRSGDLMERLQALPREIEPGRDLRPDLPPTMDADSAGRRSAYELWRPRLAAAVVLLAVLGSAVLLVVRDPGGPAQGESPLVTGSPVMPSEVLSSQLRDYERASRQLSDLYRRRRSRMDPEAAGSVDASLASLDRAIQSTAATAARHPERVLVHRMLLARYERKIELLRRTLDL